MQMDSGYSVHYDEQTKMQVEKEIVNEPIQVEEETYDYFEEKEEHTTLEEEELEALNAEQDEDTAMKTSPMDQEEIRGLDYTEDTTFDEDDGPIQLVHCVMNNNRENPIILDETETVEEDINVVMEEEIEIQTQIPIIEPEAPVEEVKKTPKKARRVAKRRVAKKGKRASKKKKTPTKKKSPAKKKKTSSKKRAARRMAKKSVTPRRTVKK